MNNVPSEYRIASIRPRSCDDSPCDGESPVRTEFSEGTAVVLAAAFSASSQLLGLKSDAPRFKRKNISATIAADVKRFCHQIKTADVFGTHRRRDLAKSTMNIPSECRNADIVRDHAMIQAG